MFTGFQERDHFNTIHESLAKLGGVVRRWVRVQYAVLVGPFESLGRAKGWMQ